MSENKQYIMQIQENGSVMISEDVVIAIASNALNELDGVAGLSTKPGADIVDMIGKKNWGKGMKVVIAEDDTVSIDCNVLVSYGHSVVDVANNIQQTITGSVESMTGVKVTSVNVNVCGIVRK